MESQLLEINWKTATKLLGEKRIITKYPIMCCACYGVMFLGVSLDVDKALWFSWPYFSRGFTFGPFLGQRECDLPKNLVPQAGLKLKLCTFESNTFNHQARLVLICHDRVSKLAANKRISGTRSIAVQNLFISSWNLTASALQSSSLFVTVFQSSHNFVFSDVSVCCGVWWW